MWALKRRRGSVRAMPNIRNMTIVLSTAVVTIGQDPVTAKVITIAKDAISFMPVSCSVDLLNSLELTASYDDHRVFVGQVDGNSFQIETIGSGVQMTAVIST
jgi:hypothetical protein